MNGKHILLCVTGGIAVYKAVALVSKLTQAGFQVKVLMSESAQQFVTPLTFQSMSRQHVYTDTFDEKDPQGIAHIDLADWADLVVVAPATANVIGKYANGIADNMITTTLLATTAPVWIAPAMNVHMYDHQAVKDNINRLYERGIQFIEPSEGYLACGYVGKGRLEEPEKITAIISSYFNEKEKQPLKGRNVLITAGPTREKIDPIRFFTNHSSGKMGYALAQAASKLGANVILVSGPTNLTPPSNVKTINVNTAQEMYDAVMEHANASEVIIGAAAVADYRPRQVYDEKMKKKDGSMIIEFERTQDILKTLGQQKMNQILVGFAAETERLEEYALKKLQSKNADLIVANNVSEKDAGFATDTNRISIFNRNGINKVLPLLTKEQASIEILKEVEQLLEEVEYENRESNR
ncbi:bifunctional phosphopantothenoylcysteine decarboxylase/phosphopantothenate--cysteine ligase CoaBC [Bacillus solimangrovi]|uniref:Coenzyme A biosynthesis bifunctional protein CoaBC n=1 Tax=Bacillus solimangrovi TaxID=1305675 RepID=A0A1E5LAT4_9BACI|nr:bifunctional phosphopantothenoylcysteine decarboxylase/phosphopantothenate--cysteine ligase CoaBC [Bacillus solimangrovi]OEH91210.1 phosphopantothenoylcysteine decarboxylase [Bacillus solimangrovi]